MSLADFPPPPNEEQLQHPTTDRYWNTLAGRPGGYRHREEPVVPIKAVAVAFGLALAGTGLIAGIAWIFGAWR